MNKPGAHTSTTGHAVPCRALVGAWRTMLVFLSAIAACADDPPPTPRVPSSASEAVAPPSPPDPMAAYERARPCDHGALAKCQAKCDGGDSVACSKVGERICSEGSVQECQTACDGNNAKACAQLAGIYEGGQRVAKDEKRAASLYDSACGRGVLSACVKLAEAYSWGRLGVTADRTRAGSYYGRGCSFEKRGDRDSDDGAACGPFAYWAPVDAAPVFESACDKGQLAACMLLVDVVNTREHAISSQTAVVSALGRLCHTYEQYGASSSYCGRLKDLGAPQ